jgi:hypothetical protein
MWGSEEDEGQTLAALAKLRTAGRRQRGTTLHVLVKCAVHYCSEC